MIGIVERSLQENSTVAATTGLSEG